jgi:hypothetical protein
VLTNHIMDYSASDVILRRLAWLYIPTAPITLAGLQVLAPGYRRVISSSSSILFPNTIASM